MTYSSGGRHFLQIPGPTNVPEQVLRAMAAPTMDHRGPEFAALTAELLAAVGPVFATTDPVVIFPGSGTGAWEAALVNTLSAGDRVLCFDTGHFAGLWQDMALRLGLQVEKVASSWRRGLDVQVLADTLAADSGHDIKAVLVVHNETSTGVTSPVDEVRAAIDAAAHPALLLVDTISSLGSIEYRHDEWGVDVTVGCSQKGLMLPPGLGFNAISSKAIDAARTSDLPTSYWSWEAMLDANQKGSFPYTPATNLLYGLREALRILQAEGLEAVFARHARHAEATRRAVDAWGLEVFCADERRHSGALTAVLLPEGHDADAFRALVLERFDMSLGSGLGKLAGKVFRIGHLGQFGDLSLIGTLGGVELGLKLAGIDVAGSGVAAALDSLETAHRQSSAGE